MLFLKKTDEAIWKFALLRVPLLSTSPPISEQFFHNLSLCPNFKNEISPPTTPPPLILRGREETME